MMDDGIGSNHPPDPAGLFSEGGGVIKLHIEGSLTMSTTGYNSKNAKIAQAPEPDRAVY